MLAAVRHGAPVSRLILSVSPVPVIPSKPAIRTNASLIFADRGSVTPVLASHALVRRGDSVITVPVTLYKTSILPGIKIPWQYYLHCKRLLSIKSNVTL